MIIPEGMDKSKSKKKKTISLPAAATLKKAQSNVDKLAQLQISRRVLKI